MGRDDFDPIRARRRQRARAARRRTVIFTSVGASLLVVAGVAITLSGRATRPATPPAAVLESARGFFGNVPIVSAEYRPLNGHRGATAQEEVEAYAARAEGRLPPRVDDRVDGAYLIEFAEPVGLDQDRHWVFLMHPDGSVSAVVGVDLRAWRKGVTPLMLDTGR